MLEDLFDHLLIFDESEDSHLTLALGAGQGINLINLLNQPHPILTIFPGGTLRFQNAWHPFILALFLPFPPGNITVIPIIPDHLLPVVRYMGTHGCQSLQRIKDLLLLGILGLTDDLGRLGQIGHSLLGERGPDDITG